MLILLLTYPHIHTINKEKEKKKQKKKEEPLLLPFSSIQKQDILTLPEIGHSYFALTAGFQEGVAPPTLLWRASSFSSFSEEERGGVRF